MKKAVIFGTQNVGKTSLVLYMKDKLLDRDNLRPTITGEAIEIQTSDGFKYNLWDTAGQEKFQSLVPMFYHGAVAGVAVFALNDLESLEKLGSYIEQYQKTAQGRKLFLVANKCDLEKEVSIEQIQNFQKKYNIASYFETSAKEGVNVSDLQEDLSNYMKNYNEYDEVQKEIIKEKKPCC